MVRCHRMKTCSQCEYAKPSTEYYTDKTKADLKRPCCKLCDNLRMKEYRKTNAHKVVFNPYQKEWQRQYRKTDKYKEFRRKEQIARRIRAKERKQAVIELLGGKCECCDITDYHFLSLDHINNDGYMDREHRKNRINTYLLYKKILDGEYSRKLRILCFNCNIARQHNGGECPHKQYAIVCDSHK